MREYTIALPMLSNSGADYHLERSRWEHAAERLAGGYTMEPYPAKGVWVAPDGIVFHDLMQAYHVATSPATIQKLITLAFELFPDQLAFYTVKGGTVEIHNRAHRRIENDVIAGRITQTHSRDRSGERPGATSARPIPLWQTLKRAVGFE